jgi:hypothetical protein
MSVTFTGNERALTLGAGPDHGLFDLYAAAIGECMINFYLDKSGSHVHKRMHPNCAAPDTRRF